MTALNGQAADGSAFQQAYYINLDRSPERRARIEGQLAALGLPAFRIPGVLAEAMPPDLTSRFRDGGKMTRGEQGCFAAHVRAWEQIAGKTDGLHLVLEDDAMLSGSILAAGVLIESQRSQAVVQLCGVLKSSAQVLAIEGGLSLVRPLFTLMNATAYAMRPAAAAALLASAWNVDLAVDRHLRHFGRYHLDMLAITPPVAAPSGAPSTMTGDRQTIPASASGSASRRSRFSLSGELRFVSRFGAASFLRVYLAYLAMKSRGLKYDVDGRYLVDGRGI